MILIGLILAALFLLSLTVAAINLSGYFLNATSTQTLTNSYLRSAEDVKHAILQPTSYSRWRTDIIATEPAGKDSWREFYSKKDTLTYSLEHQTNNTVSVALADPKMPVRLHRTYKIWEQDYLSFLTIHDSIEYTKPYMRTLAFLFFNHTKALKTTLKDLDQYLNGG